MNLLLIDDDNIDRENSIRALDRSGYPLNITEAASAEEGLKYHKDKSFDIILLDYKLPTMTGLDLLRALNESSHANIAVVMLSNMEDEDLAIKCIEAGAQDFIVKNEVTAARLIRAIRHAKERYKIEQELRESQKELQFLAEKDPLTGLSNRYVFETSLDAAIPYAKRHCRGLALLMLDLDNFKNINDTLGHSIGDKLLVEAAKRLSALVREGDILCRIGGDEFAILVHNIDNPLLLEHLTRRILAALTEPFVIDDAELIITTSIGVANYPDCATDAAQLFKCADVAMYRSKEMGKNQTHFYSKKIHDAIHRKVELERELHNAVAHNEFVVYYQPQYDCISEEVIGAEALVRWQHPEKGLIGPFEFIPIAEEIGLIDKIGQCVLETACAQLGKWNKIYSLSDGNFSVAVNLSPLQLSLHGFVKNVQDALAAHNVSPRQLEFEVTESTLIKGTDASAQVLLGLSNLGIPLALDDFGTGHSSLSQLQKYPFQILKIDRSFVQSIEDNPQDILFLEAINAFSKTLGILTVVEGVETTAQKEWCQKLAFDRIQGFYFAKPMPVDEFEILLSNAKLPV
ncbi:diguanylate cyclase [Kiloniella litopenaei]|uniref:Diguanylate cyclase n=1 Tax=Kiloniella litopenaei TaxID=1549748 RepID=A0A0M2REM4_9PROT|nr:GGDEF domain-containing response regulator [Kiloniella litopenaei]KKJ78023.1 diguanylate cyclase [Kiloniella litopenaei]